MFFEDPVPCHKKGFGRFRKFTKGVGPSMGRTEFVFEYEDFVGVAFRQYAMLGDRYYSVELMLGLEELDQGLNHYIRRTFQTRVPRCVPRATGSRSGW